MDKGSRNAFKFYKAWNTYKQHTHCKIIQSEVSQREKHQYSILMLYMEFRKMVTMTLYARQQKRHRYKERTLDSVGEGEGGII